MASPETISGLKAWWDDSRFYKSDNATNCANGDACYYWQSHGTYAPSRTLAAAVTGTYYTGVQNGRGALYFNEGAYYIQSGGWLPSDVIAATTGNGTIFTVRQTLAHSTPSYTGYGSWYVAHPSYAGAAHDTLGNTVKGRGYYYDTTYTAYIATLGAGTPASQWGIATWMLNVGTGVYAGWNDTRTASLASGSAPNNMRSEPLGSTYYVGYQAGIFLKGYLGEMIVYNRALTETERMEVESYLAQRWGISLPYSMGGSFTVIL